VGSLLILLLAAAAWAQPQKPIFPNDSKDPKQSGGAVLLEAVCPGRVIVGKGIGCRGSCPEFTGLAGAEGWTLAAVTRGHFLSGHSDDAVLSMTDCEPHSENFSGTILLTHRAQKWTMLWYKAGIDTERCHKVKLRDLREILVCLDDWRGQGLIGTGLWMEDLRNATPTLIAGGDDRPFFEVWDNSDSCGENPDDELKPYPLSLAYIGRIEFRRGMGGVASISVSAAYGERKMTREDVDACIAEQNPNKPQQGLSFLPPTKPEQIDFHFENGTYRRSPTASK